MLLNTYNYNGSIRLHYINDFLICDNFYLCFFFFSCWVFFLFKLGFCVRVGLYYCSSSMLRLKTMTMTFVFFGKYHSYVFGPVYGWNKGRAIHFVLISFLKSSLELLQLLHPAFTPSTDLESLRGCMSLDFTYFIKFKVKCSIRVSLTCYSLFF